MAANIKLPAWVQQLNAVKHLKSDDLTEEQKSRLDKARKYAEEIRPVLLERKAQIKAELDQIAAAQNTAKWIDMLPVFCRVYVGGVNYDIMEVHLRAVFGQFGYLTSVSLSYEPMESRHKGFSFIEWDTPEAATNAIAVMDGSTLGGRFIKVGRVGQYPAEGNSVLPKAPKSRIYISNIHEVVSETDIREMFVPYGSIKALYMPLEANMKKHKTYALIEYENPGAANGAIQAMNQFELGGQKLHVTKAVLGGPMPKSGSSGYIGDRGSNASSSGGSGGRKIINHVKPSVPASVTSITNSINNTINQQQHQQQQRQKSVSSENNEGNKKY